MNKTLIHLEYITKNKPQAPKRLDSLTKELERTESGATHYALTYEGLSESKLLKEIALLHERIGLSMFKHEMLYFIRIDSSKNGAQTAWANKQGKGRPKRTLGIAEVTP